MIAASLDCLLHGGGALAIKGASCGLEGRLEMLRQDGKRDRKVAK
jgi:hypothetical protein